MGVSPRGAAAALRPCAGTDLTTATRSSPQTATPPPVPAAHCHDTCGTLSTQRCTNRFQPCVVHASFIRDGSGALRATAPHRRRTQLAQRRACVRSAGKVSLRDRADPGHRTRTRAASHRTLGATKSVALFQDLEDGVRPEFQRTMHVRMPLRDGKRQFLDATGTRTRSQSASISGKARDS